MKVAEAVLRPEFLDGTYAILYCASPKHFKEADDHYWMRQVSVAVLPPRWKYEDEDRFCVQRYRSFKSKDTDPWPMWWPTRSTAAMQNGFASQWLPSLSCLLADCVLVELAPGDRVVDVMKEKNLKRSG